jgi:hypothetical protein
VADPDVQDTRSRSHGADPRETFLLLAGRSRRCDALGTSPSWRHVEVKLSPSPERNPRSMDWMMAAVLYYVILLLSATILGVVHWPERPVDAWFWWCVPSSTWWLVWPRRWWRVMVWLRHDLLSRLHVLACPTRLPVGTRLPLAVKSELMPVRQIVTMNYYGVVRLWRLSSAQVLPISSLKIIIRIKATSLCAKGHLFGMDQHGLHEAAAMWSSLEVSSVKSESLAQGVLMAMTLVSFLDNDSRLLRCVWMAFGS